jgi:hypothetical protein
MSVGVMEDYKLRDLRASHTLGRSSHFVLVYLQLGEKRRKPRGTNVTMRL